MTMKKIEILGIPFHAITVDETLDTLESYLDTDRNHVIITPNPEGVMQARRNPAFANAIKNADLSLADGTGIVLAAKLKGLKIPGRVRGLDTIFAIFDRLSKQYEEDCGSGGAMTDATAQSGRGFTAYFFGGEPGVAETAKQNMEKRYPGLNVVGYHHGFFTDDTDIIAEINALQPDFLLVCIGMPRAELWATQNKSVNAKITMCLGGTIDVMAGTAQLAPSFLRKIGLEWLYRLIKQPSRFKRQLDLPRFVLAVLFRKK